MDQKSVEDRIVQFLESDVGVAPGLNRNDALLSSGAISSFDIVAILGFLSDTFSVEISPFEVNVDNFDSIARMSELIVSRTS